MVVGASWAQGPSSFGGEGGGDGASRGAFRLVGVSVSTTPGLWDRVGPSSDESSCPGDDSIGGSNVLPSFSEGGDGVGDAGGESGGGAPKDSSSLQGWGSAKRLSPDTSTSIVRRGSNFGRAVPYFVASRPPPS